MNLACPECDLALTRLDTRAGEFWECPKCLGVAARLSVLRKTVRTPVAERIWSRLSQAARNMCPYPACRRLISVEPAPDDQSLEACSQCQMVWFGVGELASLLDPHPRPVGDAFSPAKLEKDARSCRVDCGTRQ